MLLRNQLSYRLGLAACSDAPRTGRRCRQQLLGRAGDFPRQPGRITTWITGQVGRAFGPRFHSVIDASRARAARARMLQAGQQAPRIELPRGRR
ncbi:MAG: hypothetical protein J0I72_08435 [Stenotrophomonas sp.]|nr:hypothetical protein [Stenotrophomonas sp.]